jgi:hypothetical protein
VEALICPELDANGRTYFINPVEGSLLLRLFFGGNLEMLSYALGWHI